MQMAKPANPAAQRAHTLAGGCHPQTHLVAQPVSQPPKEPQILTVCNLAFQMFTKDLLSFGSERDLAGGLCPISEVTNIY